MPNISINCLFFNLLNIIKINEGWNEAFVDERPYDENKDKDLDVNQGLAKAYRKSFDEKLYPHVFGMFENEDNVSSVQVNNSKFLYILIQHSQ